MEQYRNKPQHGRKNSPNRLKIQKLKRQRQQRKSQSLIRCWEEGAISAATAKEALESLGVAVKSAQDYFTEFGDEVVDILEGQVVNAAKEMVSVLWDSEADIGDIFSSMIENIAKMIVEMIAATAAAWAFNAALKALGVSSGGLSGGIGGGGGGGVGGIFGTILGSAVGGPVGGLIGGTIGSLLPFAKGGMVPAGIAGRGFVAHSPMRFRGMGSGMLMPAANGMVIGELGAEAVLPLARMRSGALGVEAMGGNTSINVHNYAGVDVQVKNQARVDGGRDIQFIINDAVKKEFKRGGYDRAMRGNFNMKRRGM